MNQISGRRPFTICMGDFKMAGGGGSGLQQQEKTVGYFIELKTR